MSTNPVPDEIPISIKRPLDVFMNGLPVPVVSVCCVVNTDNDNCGATVRFCNVCGFNVINYYYFFKKKVRGRENHFLCAIKILFVFVDQ